MKTDLKDSDEEIYDLAIRRKTDDKLTYKLIIANAINECVKNKSNIIKYPDSVTSFMNIISFDVKGYKLRTQIEKIKKKNDLEKEKLWLEEEKKTPRHKFYKRSYQAKFKLRLDRAYWDNLFKDIIQILANEGLLMDIEKYISVKTNE